MKKDVMALGTWELKEAYVKNLKIALGITVILHIVAMGVMLAGGYWASHRPEKKIDVRLIPYAELGPPPSLTGANPPPQPAITTPTTPPAIGVPVPVPEQEATTTTTATQTELAMTMTSSTSTGTGRDSVVIVNPENVIIPRYNEFVAYDTPPAPLETPKPEYPSMARQAGYSGRVVVQMLLNLDGSVMQVRVAKSSGHAILDEAAVEGCKKFKFTPAKQRDRPVRVWVSMPIDFKLMDQ